ncbi:erythromycin biosynthesis sensory transduction protein EryC1-like [Ylistrum balloti]|uniref:erythromycin biosynthesis sensory transduction protein EryC1-like n=1 Tax=Ylistrum balloti TaxID=509963 RepID=UPI002905B134|nr:erythromycin biosynthesis sensory transduction protein EryC1-like [Ylistrum balloti]
MALAEYFGMQHAVLIGSATDGLTLAIHKLCADRNGAILTCGHGFVAQIMASHRIQKPVILVDCTLETGQIDTNHVEACLRKNDIACLYVASLHGIAAPLTDLRRLADQYGIPMIEDFAQSAGASCEKGLVGTYGNLSVTSIYPTKPLAGIATGGAILTNHTDHADWCRRGRFFGLDAGYANEPLVHARMSELSAGAALRGLSYFETLRYEREQLFKRYQQHLDTTFHGPRALPQDGSAYHHYIIYVKNRDNIRKQLQQKSIGTGTYFPVTLLEHQMSLGHIETFEEIPNCYFHAKHNLALPLWEGLTEAQIDYICETVLKIAEPA